MVKENDDPTAAIAQLEALAGTGDDVDVVDPMIAAYEASRRARDDGREEDAVSHVDRAAQIVRYHGGSCDGPPLEHDPDLVPADSAIDVGGWITQVAAAGDDVWVSDLDGRTVTRVDATSNEIVARIDVEDADLRTIQVTPRGVWVRGETALHRIDPASNKVVDVIPKSAIGDGVTRAFVDGAAMWACAEDHLIRASVDDGHPTGDVRLGFPCGTVTREGSQLWVASDIGHGTWASIDPTTLKVRATVNVPADYDTFPAIGEGEVWSHSQAEASTPGFVAVDTTTNAVLHTGDMRGGGGPGALSDTSYYAVDAYVGEVLVIARATGKVTARLDGGASPNAVALTGATAWVVDDATGRLLRFDP